jgi:hypothetical protein
MFHKDTLHNRRQVRALMLVSLQSTHISVTAAAAAAAAEDSREAVSLYHCPLHLANPKKQTTVKGGERRFDRCPHRKEMEGVASNADATANISAASACCMQSCCRHMHFSRSGPTV